MSNFLEYINTQIQLEMQTRATSDGKRLTGLRNIKSEFDYAKGKSKDVIESDLIKKMYKDRIETSEVYKEKKQDLYIQEIIESDILKPFLPPEIKIEDVFTFLDNSGFQKNKMEFKKIQVECEKYFGQKVESSHILDWITH